MGYVHGLAQSWTQLKRLGMRVVHGKQGLRGPGADEGRRAR